MAGSNPVFQQLLKAQQADEEFTRRMPFFGNAPMVILNFGRPATTCWAFRDRLCDESPFFKANLLGENISKKRKLQTVNLNDDNRAAFEHICQWLLFRKCKFVKFSLRGGMQPYMMEVVKLYAAAEKYSMANLKAYLLNILYDFVRDYIEYPDYPRIPTLEIADFI